MAPITGCHRDSRLASICAEFESLSLQLHTGDMLGNSWSIAHAVERLHSQMEEPWKSFPEKPEPRLMVFGYNYKVHLLVHEAFH